MKLRKLLLKLRRWIEDKYRKFFSLSLANKMLMIVICLITAVIVSALLYLLYKLIVLIIPLAILVVMYLWDKNDLQPTTKTRPPENYDIIVDYQNILNCLYNSIMNIHSLFGLLVPDDKEQLMMDCSFNTSEFLCFAVYKATLNKEKEEAFSANDLIKAIEQELNKQAKLKMFAFYSTEKGLAVMGIEDEGYYYKVFITPVNNNTQAMIEKQRNARLTNINQNVEKNISDEF